jgi:hypothetical protein
MLLPPLHLLLFQTKNRSTNYYYGKNPQQKQCAYFTKKKEILSRFIQLIGGISFSIAKSILHGTIFGNSIAFLQAAHPTQTAIKKGMAFCKTTQS